jgi:hypothetical protein
MKTPLSRRVGNRMPNPSADGRLGARLRDLTLDACPPSEALVPVGGVGSLDTCEPRQSWAVQSSVEGWRSRSGNSNLRSEICNPEFATLDPLQEIVCVRIMNVERNASDMRASR